MPGHIISCMWSCAADLTGAVCTCYVCSVHIGQRERAWGKKRERERESSKWTPYTYTGWEHREKESDPPPCQARRAASYMSDKRNRARVWLDGVLRQWGTWFSRLFLWQRGSVLSALQHCGWGERGEESLCGTPSWAPNQAPPCGAWANRQLAAEVKDCQLQERAAGREGLLGNLDPSFPSSPNVLNW